MAAGPSTSVMAIFNSQQQLYPAPLRYHIDVAMNPDTFFETLIDFHSAMGTRLMYPVLAGAGLDLHQLYFLVTSEGGVEKAISQRKWRKVITELNIPLSVTNRSFVVKRHYIKLLYHYEQVYYFRRRGPVILPSEFAAIIQPRRSGRNMPFYPPIINDLNLEQGQFQSPTVNDHGSTSSSSLPQTNGLGGNRTQIATQTRPPTILRIVAGTSEPAQNGPVFMEGTSTNGTENAAALGDNNPSDRTLSVDTPNYHVPVAPNLTETTATGTNFRRLEPSAAQANNHWVPLVAPTLSRPKPCKDAYGIFFDEKYSVLKHLLPNSAKEFVKLIDESWNRLTEDEREIYTDQERKDKERYKRELQEYKQKMREALRTQG